MRVAFVPRSAEIQPTFCRFVIISPIPTSMWGLLVWRSIHWVDNVESLNLDLDLDLDLDLGLELELKAESRESRESREG